MTDKDEWGPWIEHDGKGCPVLGMWVHRLFCDGSERNGVLIQEQKLGSWYWAGNYVRVTKYRIRKPRGMAILQNIAANPKRELETT